jgi:intraflagellar transport protein 56
MEFKLKCQDGDVKNLLMWVAYCAFHLGNYKRSELAYKELIEAHGVSNEFQLNIACCYFYQQMYDESLAATLKGPQCPLQNRLLFNIYHRLGDEKKLLTQHQNLKDTKEDQLALASIHFLRSHYQEVILLTH